jgi:signal transduction histidine kinase
MTPDNLDLFAVLDSLAEGVTLTDMEGRIFFSNKAAHRILGVSATNTTPDTWAAHYGVFLPDGETPFPTERYTLVKALRGEETDGTEMLIRNAGNPEGRLISTSSRPLRDPTGVQVGGAVILRDITRQRAAERMKEELTALIVHDLKSPLTAIMGEAQLLLLSDAFPEADRESVNAILNSSTRLNRMVLDLLDVHLGEDGALEAEAVPTPVPALLVEVRDYMKSRSDLIRQQILGPEAPTDLVAWMDPGLMRRVLQNLVDNCVKYAGEGGTIWLKAERSGGAVRISVRDDGPGVPPNLRARIFEKYSSVERDDAGRRLDSRGLGLRFCHVAVAAHGGRIWVEDNQPRGACFCVELQASA